MKTYFLNAQKLPLVIESAGRDKSIAHLSEIIADQRVLLRENLLRYGAILFRGFDGREIEEFERVARLFSGRDFFSYAGGVSPRISLNGGIYASTEYPPDLPLALHNGLSYSENFPRHLYFFCHTAPAQGGETTLGDNRRILQNITPKTAGLFKYKGVRCDRYLIDDTDSQYSWQAAFETRDKAAAESVCRQIGAEFEWKKNGGLRVSQIRPATVKHPETGEEVWFNQADGFHPSNLDAETRHRCAESGEEFRLNAHFGDGLQIAELMLEQIRCVIAEETVPHRWQTGDILILDNLLTAHGRMPFSGARKICLAMT